MSKTTSASKKTKQFFVKLVDAFIYIYIPTIVLLPIGFIISFFISGIIYDVFEVDISSMTYSIYLVFSGIFAVLFPLFLFGKRLYNRVLFLRSKGYGIKTIFKELYTDYIPNINKGLYLFGIIGLLLNIIVFTFISLMLPGQVVNLIGIFYTLFYGVFFVGRLKDSKRPMYLLLLLLVPIPSVQICFLLYLLFV